ncbi:MAG: hypothetical protein ACI9LG_002470 [Moritella dasanensis]|jgi:hypothetical protein
MESQDMSYIGKISKLVSTLNADSSVSYQLPLSHHLIPLNDLIGKKLTLTHTGIINCSSCGKVTKKSYSQGHCFVCMRKLASCDMCMMKPETCHYEHGTCREPDWADGFCMTDHYVYLSNTSALKVGITRNTQLPTRWIDQGATQGLPIFKVKTRQISGLVEVELAEFISDKTNWRTMLKGDNAPIDLKVEAERLIPLIEEQLGNIELSYGLDAIEQLDEDIVTINYPVTEFPTKIVSHNFDKDPIVSGILQGIKGQYLLFDTGVINIRKFTSYEVTLTL